VTPATPEFYVIQEVVMIETSPSRDDGFPDKEVKTVIVTKKRKIRRDQVAEETARVMR
jgi:hypothetical protein